MRRAQLLCSPRHAAAIAVCRVRADAMLIDFFFTLRAAKLKVSVKEYLTLLEASRPA